MLDDFMYNRMNCELDDNSHESLAQALITLCYELYQGKTDLLQQYRDSEATKTESCRKGQLEPPTVEDELDLQLETLGISGIEEVKDEAMEEDGFTMVTRSRARRS